MLPYTDKDNSLIYGISLEHQRMLRAIPPNENGVSRQSLIDEIDIIKHNWHLELSQHESEFATTTSVRSVVSFFAQIATKEEMQYLYDQLQEMLVSGIEPCREGISFLLCLDFEQNRYLGLSDKEYVDKIISHPSFYISRLTARLHDDTIRAAYTAKAEQNVSRFAYDLGVYYYNQKMYTEAFEFLKNIEDFQQASLLIGLMYYYGKGVKKNYDLAQKYLEAYSSSVADHNTEHIYVLGRIYESKQHFADTRKLYQEALSYPYGDKNDTFAKKMRHLFLERYGCTHPDTVWLTVDIKPENLFCEFSIELAKFSSATVCWNEYGRKCELSSCNTVTEDVEIITFKHRYEQPGRYTISIVTKYGRTLSGLDFSKYQRQLIDVDLQGCTCLNKISFIDQLLKQLYIPHGKYLHGLVCRGNNITELDLRRFPNLTHLDCSKNPIQNLLIRSDSALTKVCINGIDAETSLLERIVTYYNRGKCCDTMSYIDLERIDMRLEHYFRRTNWDKVQKYLRKHYPEYYYHELNSCKEAFTIMKMMVKSKCLFPRRYNDGYLAVHDSYVSDDTILNKEDYYLTSQLWSTSLATKVRDAYHRDPWLCVPQATPEYFVVSCLINMVHRLGVDNVCEHDMIHES